MKQNDTQTSLVIAALFLFVALSGNNQSFQYGDWFNYGTFKQQNTTLFLKKDEAKEEKKEKKEKNEERIFRSLLDMERSSRHIIKLKKKTRSFAVYIMLLLYKDGKGQGSIFKFT